MNLLLVVLLGACGSTEPEVVSCEFTGCDQLCVEVGSTWSCGDTAAMWESCYDDGFKVCEAQPDNTCGWTVVDQAGWDDCVAADEL
jgi:hypothetical protein